MSKRLHEVVMAVLGPGVAAVVRGADGNPGDGIWQRSWLYYQASSIWAGTNEIQRDDRGRAGARPAPTMTTDPREPARWRGCGSSTSAPASRRPFCAGLLGELGAEVIKVEHPAPATSCATSARSSTATTGATTRCSGRSRDGRQSVTLDLRTPEGQDLFRRLAATADVVVENFRPGTLERWHIGPDDCDPELVWVRI